MTGFIDLEGRECDFATWYSCLTGPKAQQKLEAATAKDGSVFTVWSRFKGVGGQAWQTTSELQDPKKYDPKNPVHKEWHRKKDVEASEEACAAKGDEFKSGIDKAQVKVIGK